MFKKITIIASGLILCVAFISGCSSSEIDPATSGSAGETTKVDQIKETGKLILATSADYPPFETHTIEGDSDQITGWDIDLANKIAEALSVELEIKDMSFDAILTALGSGQADLAIAGFGQTPERDQSFDPSKPYYTTTNVMLVQAGKESSYPDLASFAGKKIGAQEATVQADLVAQYLPDSEATVVKSIPNLVLSLKSGKIDGLLLDSPVASDYINANSDLAAAPAKFDMAEAQEPKVIYVQKNQPGWIDFINSVIEEQAQSIYPAL
ncbi:MAG: transporter substrate-binding domain-containing protein [Bifidobacteriaceae bacterium]|jgi:polar amino acid transport system substrate-binding protein|nr:transporter substrate-binding domain-containing protein [Bifidobacteriaceae bacterium]